MDEISTEEQALIEQNERSRMIQVDELIGDALDMVQRQGSFGTLWSLKNLYSLNALRGTDGDKQLKRAQLAQDHANPRKDQRLVFVFNGTPQILTETIDAELS